MQLGRSSTGSLSRSVCTASEFVSACNMAKLLLIVSLFLVILSQAPSIIVYGVCVDLSGIMLQIVCVACRFAASISSKGISMKPATAVWQSVLPKPTMYGTDLSARGARHGACACLVSLLVLLSIWHLRLDGHLGMRAFVTPRTPKLVHKFAVNAGFDICIVLQWLLTATIAMQGCFRLYSLWGAFFCSSLCTIPSVYPASGR